ncbi:MAG: 6-pyruvoyl trahydropterin synthase family protein [Spirochaetaceae bacterium]
MMFTVAVRRDFIARHYLIGGDFGAENELHAHHYYVEMQLRGPELDEYGYLVDIVEIESVLDSLSEYYRNSTLNDLPEFEGRNPSVERLAYHLCRAFERRISAETVTAVTARVWENDIAWASYRMERR